MSNEIPTIKPIKLTEYQTKQSKYSMVGKLHTRALLVGQSGSGKTTLADMIPRFYDTDLGEIKIDGISLKDLEIESLRKQIGVVTQESILFNDTIENNIAFG